jgi:hypothetical protein
MRETKFITARLLKLQSREISFNYMVGKIAIKLLSKNATKFCFYIVLLI